MVDLIALLLLAVALLQAPKDARTFSLDAVDPSNGRLESLDVTRTDEGFTLKSAKGEGGAVTFKRVADKEGVFVATFGGNDPTEIDAREVMKQLAAGKGDDRTATQGETTIKVSTRGEIQYVMAKGASQMIVRRPAKAAAAETERTLTGVVKHRKDTGRMSTDNYKYGEFIITLDDGRILTLVPTATVSKDDLLKLDGQKVEATGVETAARAPDPREAHPVDGEGKALPRAPRFEVRSVKLKG